MEKTSASVPQQPWMKVTEIDIVYKNKLKVNERPKVDDSKDLYQLFRSVWNMDTIGIREEFKVVFMNTGNRALGLMHTFIGGINTIHVDSRLILAVALKAGATRIAVAHNHPSGTLTPSAGDIHITRRLKEACIILDIHLLDHMILSGGDDGYYSMAANGEL